MHDDDDDTALEAAWQAQEAECRRQGIPVVDYSVTHGPCPRCGEITRHPEIVCTACMMEMLTAADEEADHD